MEETRNNEYKRVRGFEKISIKEWEKEEAKPGYENIVFPERATLYSAGYDIRTPYGFSLKPGEERVVATGLKAYMLPNEFLAIYPRGGLGFKYYIRLANTVGVVDSDYYNNSGNEGHLFVKLRNEGKKELQVYVKDAIAQAIFQKYLSVDGDVSVKEQNEKLPHKKERIGGFGSTGK